MNSVREEITLWKEDARYDLSCAEDMLEKRRYNYVVWLARQAVEKILKAAHSHVLKKPIPIAHNLLKIAEAFVQELPPEIKTALVFLNPHYLVTRYVNAGLGKPSELFDKEFAEQALEKAREALRWVEENYLV